jgi:MscS family membrane protein
MRRQRLLLQVTYSTSREKLELLAERIKQAITEHPLTNKANLHVRFNDFGESSLNILVIFFIEVADYAGELAAREEILLQIMDLAVELGIDFAFPTRTLMIETPAERQADLFRHPVEAFATSR